MTELKNVRPPGAIEAAIRLQKLINSGEAFRFPNTFGKLALEAIRDGRNYLPVPVPGKVGSYEYVVERMGEAYARKLKETV